MRRIGIILFLVSLSIISTAFLVKETTQQAVEIVSCSFKPSVLSFHCKNAGGDYYKNTAALKSELESKGKKLKFAMNGGMFMKDYTPLGLYIENGKVLTNLNTRQNAYGNFYLQPNGVFCISNQDKAQVVTTKKFKSTQNIKFATQSGPMLVIDGKIHPKFTKGSSNKRIRNGVGVLPNGEVLCAISKEPINLYDFAQFFKSKGCNNALYMDGVVSRMYAPDQGIKQTGGTYSVIIAVIQ